MKYNNKFKTEMVKVLQNKELTKEERLQVKLHYTKLELDFMKQNLNWLERLEKFWKELKEKPKEFSRFNPFLN